MTIHVLLRVAVHSLGNVDRAGFEGEGAPGPRQNKNKIYRFYWDLRFPIIIKSVHF
jgi:hypothetical protein